MIPIKPLLLPKTRRCHPLRTGIRPGDIRYSDFQDVIEYLDENVLYDLILHLLIEEL